MGKKRKSHPALVAKRQAKEAAAASVAADAVLARSRAIKWWGWVRKSVGLAVAIVVGWAGFHSDIGTKWVISEIGSPLPENPFNAIFRLENTGSLPVSNVSVELFIVKALKGGGTIENTGVSKFTADVELLEPPDSFSFSMNLVPRAISSVTRGKEDAVRSATVAVDIHYKPFWRVRQTKRKGLRLDAKPNGELTWIETPASQLNLLGPEVFKRTP